MKPTIIGITGATGFLGWHMRVWQLMNPSVSFICAGRDTFANPAALRAFAASCKAIVHLAGANRGDDQLVENGNVAPARALTEACRASQSTPHIVFANSTHSLGETVYGRSKKLGARLLADWAGSSGARFTNLILPHVFGEGGRPNYNSVVATFSHELATGGTPRIIHDGNLELIHAQRVCAEIFRLIDNGTSGDVRLQGVPMTVSALLQRLQELDRDYCQKQIIPRLGDQLDLELFNTYRSYLFPMRYPVPLSQRQDARGALFEAVKSTHGGQCFVSTTRFGITRGNHFHSRKLERFLVLRGNALIRVRRLLDHDIREFRVSGSTPCYVDMPTFHTHDITNIDREELVTLFWSHELFDPDNSDTYPEKV